MVKKRNYDNNIMNIIIIIEDKKVLNLNLKDKGHKRIDKPHTHTHTHTRILHITRIHIQMHTYRMSHNK